jgi:heme oxygenase
MVSDVLELVARGLPWRTISEEFRGSVSEEAIAESVQFASRAFDEHSNKYIVKEYVLERAG